MALLKPEFDADDELCGDVVQLDAQGEEDETGDEASRPGAKKKGKNSRQGVDAWRDFLKPGESDGNPKHVKLAKDRQRKEQKKTTHKVKKGTRSFWVNSVRVA